MKEQQQEEEMFGPKFWWKDREIYIWHKEAKKEVKAIAREMFRRKWGRRSACCPAVSENIKKLKIGDGYTVLRFPREKKLNFPLHAYTHGEH